VIVVSVKTISDFEKEPMEIFEENVHFFNGILKKKVITSDYDSI